MGISYVIRYEQIESPFIFRLPENVFNILEARGGQPSPPDAPAPNTRGPPNKRRRRKGGPRNKRRRGPNPDEN